MSPVLNYKSHISFSTSLVLYVMGVACPGDILTLFIFLLFCSLLIFDISSQVNYLHESLCFKLCFQVNPSHSYKILKNVSAVSNKYMSQLTEKAYLINSIEAMLTEESGSILGMSASSSALKVPELACELINT